ncbi:class I SAM-dependent methyltransferase [Candidatus Pelagibacter sp. HIMB1517]|uniref:class I SAM-dependent methyltransferase n=1 Tax=Candidatus Pelagibacter sp. HIMB1517 TaxID=3413341 RepID=UPI003F84913D
MNSLYFNITKKDIVKRHHCPLCFCKNYKKISDVFYKNKFIFFSTSICSECKLIFRTEHPSQKWFKNQFKKREKTQLKKKSGINLGYEKFRKIRYLKLFKYLQKFIKFKNLLDVGCATGLGLKHFSLNGIFTKGIDIDKTRVNYGKSHKINLEHGDIYTFQTKKKYDLIILSHVFEHLLDLKKAIYKLKKILKPKGYLYIEVPDVKNTVRSWTDSIYLSHLYNFSEQNLTKYLEYNGFKVLNRSYPQTENGEENIGLLFKFEAQRKKVKNFYIKENYEFEKKYLINGDKKRLKIPYSINLDKINDLSICYKVPNFKQSAQESNYCRKLEKNKINNKYEVKLENKKVIIKKQKFRKNIKFEK